MRKGYVYFKDIYAGELVENADGYIFSYDSAYLNNPESRAISLTLPLRKEPYQSNILMPFFDGLIPEGWLLDVASHNWKINQRDRMGLLLVCCADCIGAVSVKPSKDNTHE